MTPEQSTNSGQLEDLRRQLAEGKALTDRLLDCQEAHLREISNLNAAQQSAEKRAEHFRAERDALQARIDGAVDLLTFDFDKRSSVKLAIEILTGEGE